MIPARPTFSPSSAIIDFDFSAFLPLANHNWRNISALLMIYTTDRNIDTVLSLNRASLHSRVQKPFISNIAMHTHLLTEIISDEYHKYIQA